MPLRPQPRRRRLDSRSGTFRFTGGKAFTPGHPPGLKGARENWFRPVGTRSVVPLLPGTHVPGYHLPPLRGWDRRGRTRFESLLPWFMLKGCSTLAARPCQFQDSAPKG
ncbi:hypothetical protein SBA1_170043 [Candidatus Sulfotelmatobacter kueseliae]|uniref:Uncharacterized protein n=1 Tax=Candidatus Sulfotelmatobacter kueseliae TaxID=2042962 RepID=A0A2U3KBD3_9BACT|nr:hypothetical protein SBA1_170043 [Candidatus Sulfotelmatobacter kueseliae]